MKLNNLKLLSAAAVVLGMTIAAGAILPDFSKEDLATQAEAVVLAEVLEQNCYWSEDSRGIFTDVSLRIKQQFKGEDLTENLTIQIPGGKVGEITQVVSDVPFFSGNSEVIIHLFRQDNGSWWVYGWERGVLLVSGGFVSGYDMTIADFAQFIKSISKSGGN